jgi:hypothetical protein
VKVRKCSDVLGGPFRLDKQGPVSRSIAARKIDSTKIAFASLRGCEPLSAFSVSSDLVQVTLNCV